MSSPGSAPGLYCRVTGAPRRPCVAGIHVSLIAGCVVPASANQDGWERTCNGAPSTALHRRATAPPLSLQMTWGEPQGHPMAAALRLPARARVSRALPAVPSCHCLASCGSPRTCGAAPGVACSARAPCAAIAPPTYPALAAWAPPWLPPTVAPPLSCIPTDLSALCVHVTKHTTCASHCMATQGEVRLSLCS